MHPFITVVLGMAMTFIGITGIIRQESGVLSPAERKTLLGRALTLVLGLIWLITGMTFIVASASSDSSRQTFVGLVALGATASFLVVFVVMLFITMLLPTSLRRSAPAAELRGVRIMLPIPTPPRFRRMQPVAHREYGHGVVLSTYNQDNIEMIAVRFRYEVFAVPADSLDTIAASKL